MIHSLEGSAAVPRPGDWRLELPEPRRRALRVWFWSLAGMTLAVLIVGGITRLTQSGLSMVDWNPIMGVVPPLTEAQWVDAFERYRQFPEYQQLRRGMTLPEFQFIFFWEYLHRMVARTIGLVFLVPFLVFWARGYLTRPLAVRALALFGLGAAQGLMGWLMVKSGLVDQPHVSHYRLAAHLSLAFVIFGVAVWLARELAIRPAVAAVGAGVRRGLLRWLGVVGVLLALQVVWGAFVAGLKAGLYFNTFPLMGGGLVPPGLLAFEPALQNFVQNPIAVQWVHRLLGTVLALAVLGLGLRAFRGGVDGHSRRLAGVLVILMLVQYLLGVLTLLYFVPVTLGVTHQAMAMVIFGVWVVWLHHVRNLKASGTAAAAPSGRATAALHG
jgi:heme a synthase